jgi:hypothetical protein
MRGGKRSNETEFRGQMRPQTEFGNEETGQAHTDPYFLFLLTPISIFATPPVALILTFRPRRVFPLFRKFQLDFRRPA